MQQQKFPFVLSLRNTAYFVSIDLKILAMTKILPSCGLYPSGRNKQITLIPGSDKYLDGRKPGFCDRQPGAGM